MVRDGGVFVAREVRGRRRGDITRRVGDVVGIDEAGEEEDVPGAGNYWEYKLIRSVSLKMALAVVNVHSDS